VSERTEEQQILQKTGTDLLLNLYGLTRSVVLYEPNNDTIANQVELLIKLVRGHARQQHEGLRLQLLSDEFFINGRLLRADPRFWERGVELAKFLDQLELGELAFDAEITGDQLHRFVGDLSTSLRSQRNQLDPEGYGGLQTGESSGQSMASFDFKPDRFAMLICGSLLEVMEWFYAQRERRGLSLLPLRRSLQLVIDTAAKDPAMFQIIAAIRDPAQPLSWSQARLAATIDTVCFGHFLTLHRREVMSLALAAVLSGVSDQADPKEAVRPLLHLRGLRDAAMPMVLAVHDARAICQGGRGGMAGHLLAVCEVYHDLTAANQEGLALTPREALKIMLEGQIAGLDRGTVQAFADYKGPHPLGSAVVLSNGATAVVIAHGATEAARHRPTVMLFDGEGLYGEPTNLATTEEFWIERHPGADEVQLNLART